MSAAFTLDEQIAEVDREIKMRISVYARNVEAKKMSQAKADQQIACMRAVAATLRELAHDAATLRELALARADYKYEDRE